MVDCNATLLERAYNQTGVPGFLSLQNCPVPFGGIWRYYVNCDQHGHCIPINGTQSGLQPTWERTLEMILEPVLHMFVKGPLVGVFQVRLKCAHLLPSDSCASDSAPCAHLSTGRRDAVQPNSVL